MSNLAAVDVLGGPVHARHGIAATSVGDRRICTSTVAETNGSSERTARVPDTIIGLSADAAIHLIEQEGLAVRDLTDSDTTDGDFNPDRINIWTVDIVVDFRCCRLLTGRRSRISPERSRHTSPMSASLTQIALE